MIGTPNCEPRLDVIQKGISFMYQIKHSREKPR